MVEPEFHPRLCDLEAAISKGKGSAACWGSDLQSEISELVEQVSGKVDFLYRDGFDGWCHGGTEGVTLTVLRRERRQTA